MQKTLKAITITDSSIIQALKLAVLSHLCRRGHHVLHSCSSKSSTALQKHIEDFLHRLAAPVRAREKQGNHIHTMQVAQNSRKHHRITVMVQGKGNRTQHVAA